MSVSACFLVTHGSRNPRSQAFVRDVSARLQARYALPVSGGCLEGAAQPLAAQIVAFGQQLARLECRHLAVVPLFLLPGIHTCQDVPAQVAIARTALAAWSITVSLRNFLGSHPEMPERLQRCFERTDGSGDRLLVAHGSKYPGANDAIARLAERVGAEVAFWAMPPLLTDRLMAAKARGTHRVALLPYFLAEGGITAAIATAARTCCPELEVSIAPVPCTPDDLARMAMDLACAAVSPLFHPNDCANDCHAYPACG